MNGVAKVIIINDTDGHAHAIEYSDDSMRWLLQAVLDADAVNSVLDDPDQARALLKSFAPAAEIEEFLWEQGPVDRSGGGKLYFVELQATWRDKLNPFI